jgi:tRNA (guanosine-2'-O-)-methyltransferase
VKWVQQNTYDHPATLIKDLKARKYTIYTTNLSSDAVSIHDVDWTQPSAIVIGNENRGVSPEMTEYADKNILIPMFGMVESLNVSVATAVILFEACRQRIEASKYPQSDLDAKWMAEMTEKWVKINRLH